MPADDLSLLNGADSFQRYCTECHGWDPAAQRDALYDDDIVPPPAPPLPPASAPPIDWPEWAGPPPQRQPEPDPEAELQAEVLRDMVGAIDRVYSEDDPYAGSPGLAAGTDADDDRLPAPGATDLTDPRAYLYGTEETDLFRNIAEGVGVDMPGYLEVLGSEEAVWDLVNYIRSLWGEA